MPNPYAEIFHAPGAKGFAAAGFVARMPMAMAPIGIVAMLSQTHGEYWLAGAVAATDRDVLDLSAPNPRAPHGSSPSRRPWCGIQSWSVGCTRVTSP